MKQQQKLLKQSNSLLTVLSAKHASFCTGKEEDCKQERRYYTAFNHAMKRFNRRFNALHETAGA